MSTVWSILSQYSCSTHACFGFAKSHSENCEILFNYSAMEDKRTKFGTRYLSDESEIYKHNSWDNVTWDQEFKEDIVKKISLNSHEKLPECKITELEVNAPIYWDDFYDKHNNRFFKDRHWLFTEFPELLPKDNNQMKILELGCGVGNTVFPLLEVSNSESLFVYCCDFSKKAVEIVKENSAYNEERCLAFHFDITSDWSVVPIALQSLDVVTLIFVLSAIDPGYHNAVISNIIPYLKPNGIILFRDYGYCDLTQARFKNGRCIKENFYVRGDGTRAYFFDELEVDRLFTNCGLNKMELNVDRRLQVNRANKKKMYRIWIQAKYTKLSSSSI